VIIDVPAETPVTKPPAFNIPAALIVATPVLALDQTPPVVASANWVVDPTHTLAVPVIAAGAAGKSFTFIVLVPLADGVPSVVNVKVTIPVKLASGV